MKKKTPTEDFDTSFYTLANEIRVQLERNIEDPSQAEQVNNLLALEIEFKETILKYTKQSTEIYKKFLQHITLTNKNILSARPYFRERAVNFSKNITPAIKKKDIETLKKFTINYQFIAFIRNRWLGPFPKKAEKLYQKVRAARNKLIENNAPLAVNRARIFYSKTHKGSLTLNDLVGICFTGLAAGIDKFAALSYNPQFKSTCIGRMHGNMISDYSDTVIHFYPMDKKIIYRANSIRGKMKIEDIEELTKAVNDSFDEDKKMGMSIPKKVTVSELSTLMSAASTVSADATVNDEGFGVYDYHADPSVNIEKSYIEKDFLQKALETANKLSIIKRKVLKLKGLKV